ncbi:c-type cytochrome [Parahaliea mediterranea]|uniref:Cytochrome c n=1 Tax=Parahaliea mediterranea TaxID=651086 RepID=A0A939ILL4_9GAMM|nr:cytochrome c [Parahaliea mediterranea]MBN7796098.1 cytochrome c [Parahaliea mediterranea]
MIDPRNDDARGREKPEPHEQNGGIPRYLQLMVVVLVCWGFTYIMFSPYQRQLDFVPSAVAAEAGADGEQLYNNNCASCHQASGAGIPGVFPPLARSEWVTGDERLVVQILLRGLSGEISVAGVTYNGMMPPFGNSLGDAEIAALASYIRGAWSNDAGAVNVSAVTAERAAQSERTTPWSVGELQSLFGDG